MQMKNLQTCFNFLAVIIDNQFGTITRTWNETFIVPQGATLFAVARLGDATKGVWGDTGVRCLHVLHL